MIKAIVAVDESNSIGWKDGRLPWSIPYDMKRFKQLTTGCTVVMGANTFKSLGRSGGLPNRVNVVISSQNRESLGASDAIQVLSSVQDARDRFEDFWVIGGAQIYSSFLAEDLIDELYLTTVHQDSEANVKFPIDLYNWKLFMIRQRSINRPWQLDNLQIPPLDECSTPITFIQLSRNR